MGTVARRVGTLRSDCGAELIEMAMVTPILLLILAGIFDFGMLFRAWEVVTNAAREGARVGVLPAYTEDENVRQRVEQYLQASGLATTCTLQTISGGACPATLCSVCVQNQTMTTSAGSYTARVVTVVSTQSLPSLSVIEAFFGGGISTVNVGSTTAMRVESPGTSP